MSKCNKVKNPCKICLQPVTHKTGLQCHGACESWVHYSCLHYTPGKIRDIKAGVIKVTCPCPDCKTSLPKEYRTDEPYTCTNLKCPANQPPRCGNMKCPTNLDVCESKINQMPSRPLNKCGNDCKKFSNSNLPRKSSSSKTPSRTSSDGYSKCAAGCISSNEVAGDGVNGSMNMPSLTVVEKMCKTVGDLTNQINDLMMQMRQTGKSTGGCCPTNHQTCKQKGPKSHCPKPCYCPGNPKK